MFGRSAIVLVTALLMFPQIVETIYSPALTDISVRFAVSAQFVANREMTGPGSLGKSSTLRALSGAGRPGDHDERRCGTGATSIVGRRKRVKMSIVHRVRPQLPPRSVCTAPAGAAEG